MKSLKLLLSGTTLVFLGLVTTASQTIYEDARPIEHAFDQMAAVGIGDKAPDIAMRDPEGNIRKLSDLTGQVVLIDFWASWCAPCLRSMPAYNELYNRYHEQGLEFVAINVDNPIEDGLDFLLDTPLDFLIPSDPDGEVTERFGVVGMPTSYLIDPTGKVRLVHMGFRDGDMVEIEAAIQAVLAE